MKKIKGPAIFLAQFVGDDEPFNNLKNISSWASKLGYKGVQIPSWDNRLIDLDKAAESKDYCDDLRCPPLIHVFVFCLTSSPWLRFIGVSLA